MTTFWGSTQSLMAQAEGWEVFVTDVKALRYEIQRLDEVGIFDSDPEAWEHIVKWGLIGSPLHLEALSFMMNRDPEEFTKIISYCRNLVLEGNSMAVDVMDTLEF